MPPASVFRVPPIIVPEQTSEPQLSTPELCAFCDTKTPPYSSHAKKRKGPVAHRSCIKCAYNTRHETIATPEVPSKSARCCGVMIMEWDLPDSAIVSLMHFCFDARDVAAASQVCFAWAEASRCDEAWAGACAHAGVAEMGRLSLARELRTQSLARLPEATLQDLCLSHGLAPFAIASKKERAHLAAQLPVLNPREEECARQLQLAERVVAHEHRLYTEPHGVGGGGNGDGSGDGRGGADGGGGSGDASHFTILDDAVEAECTSLVTEALVTRLLATLPMPLRPFPLHRMQSAYGLCSRQRAGSWYLCVAMDAFEPRSFSGRLRDLSSLRKPCRAWLPLALTHPPTAPDFPHASFSLRAHHAPPRSCFAFASARAGRAMRPSNSSAASPRWCARLRKSSPSRTVSHSPTSAACALGSKENGTLQPAGHPPSCAIHSEGEGRLNIP